MESIIRDHILKYFKDNKLFSFKQYGFLKGRSTVSQLLKILDDITSMLESGGQVDVIYTDLEKAFDKIPHERLLLKLKSYDFNGYILSWNKAFMSNRSQRVTLDVVFSDWKPVTSAVPQGSVLGTLLFLIYINDLPEVCENFAEILLYADDAKIYRHILKSEDHYKLQEGLSKFKAWMDKWLLKLNVEKCKVVSYGRCTENYSNYYVISSNVISNLDFVNCYKDLGVIFDKHLNFSEHIDTKVNKAYQMLGLIKRHFKYLKPDTLLLLYKSLVRSHLEYAHSVWNPYRKTDTEHLENVQMRATKLIPSLKHKSYIERLKYLKLPTLFMRRIRGDLIEVYKILNNMYDNESSLQLTLSEAEHLLTLQLGDTNVTQ